MKSINIYIKNNFANFLTKINLDQTNTTYNWLNLSIHNSFLKIDLLDREYILCMTFTEDIYGIVSFKLNKYFELGTITII